jgi:hypothetical protein
MATNFWSCMQPVDCVRCPAIAPTATFDSPLETLHYSVRTVTTRLVPSGDAIRPVAAAVGAMMSPRLAE